GMSRTIFLKRHRRGAGEDNPACAEATAVEQCRHAGVPVMQIAAVGAGNLRRGTWQSFFMSEQAGSGVSAFKRIQQLQESAAADDRELRQIVAAVAQTAYKLHSASMFHGDCHWPHFILDTDTAGHITTTLIDLQGTRHRTGAAAHYG